MQAAITVKVIFPEDEISLFYLLMGQLIGGFQSRDHFTIGRTCEQ